MINKLFNWVGGGFFRTLGRFLAFIALGFLASVIISKNDIKWTDLLGIETVKADTYSGQYIGASSYRTGSNSQWYNLGISNDKYWLATHTLQGTQRYIYKFGNAAADPITLDNGVSYMLFNVKLEVYEGSTINLDHMQCFFAGSQLSNGYPIYSQLNCNVDGDTQNGTIEDYDVTLTVNYWYNNNVDLVTSCYIQSYANNVYTIMCPKITDNISGLQFNVNSGKSTRFNLGYNYLWTKVSDSASGINNAINSQTQQQAQEHNETINTITDTNTTEASSEATNFFGNFNSQDNGGISSIITAPLQAISGLVSATCNQIILPIPYLDNKQLVLPCMSAIYTEHFGSFFTIYQTIIFGAIAYRIVVSLFMMIQGFKNPDDDKIEVVDL